MKSDGTSAWSLVDRILRHLLRFIPPNAALPVLRGPLKGKRWIVGSSDPGLLLGSQGNAWPIPLEEAVTEGAVVFDVGAHAGFYTLLASVLVGPGGRVFAFEPLQRNLHYLKRHLQLNHIENVTVIEAAVSDRVGMASFDEGPRGSMGHMASHGKLQVKTVSIDDLVGTGEIPSPDYIILDVPGAETVALAGARSTLERCHATIFLATHGPEVQRECRRFLESLGYQIQAADGVNVEKSHKLLATYKEAG